MGDVAGHERSDVVCALPGCGASIEPVAGRPQRKYCSTAHRAAMRRLRRAAAHAARDPRVVETLPWLREPSAGPAPGVPRDVPVPAPREGTGPRPASGTRDGRSRWARGPARRRRAVAVLGATAVLLGGSVLTVAWG
ncbi:hypothetical protein ACFQH9_26675, partial [Pseudonocardia lutea]